jgi:hypothetical protein
MNPMGPQFNPQTGIPAPGGAAQEAVNVPSLLLMVFGAIAVLLSIANMFTSNVNAEQMAELMSNPDIPEGIKNFLTTLTGPVSKVMNLFSAGISFLMVFGAWQMRNLKSYPLAITACIVGMIPCQNCCCVTLPVGIWALTVLMRPEVKSAFS